LRSYDERLFRLRFRFGYPTESSRREPFGDLFRTAPARPGYDHRHTFFCERTVMQPVFAFGLGPLEVLIVGIVVLLLFGNRLPTLMRSLGRGVIEFKKGAQGIDDDIDEKRDEGSKVNPRR
jgi:sec-independent protein translocase protein TatA